MHIQIVGFEMVGEETKVQSVALDPIWHGGMQVVFSWVIWALDFGLNKICICVYYSPALWVFWNKIGFISCVRAQCQAPPTSSSSLLQLFQAQPHCLGHTAGMIPLFWVSLYTVHCPSNPSYQNQEWCTILYLWDSSVGAIMMRNFTVARYSQTCPSCGKFTISGTCCKTNFLSVFLCHSWLSL